MSATRTTGKDGLQRLRVLSPCEASWAGMQGDTRQRHCAQCDKHVYDFAELTPREISGVIAASGGDFCARLTRGRDGQLVTRRPAPPPVAARRASPLATVAVAAAAMVSAALGVSGAAWAAPAAPTTETGPGAAEGAAGKDRQPGGRGAAGSLSGRLVTEGDEPVPAAEITAFGQLDGQQRRATTDADGRFTLPVGAGLYNLSATIQGHSLASIWDVLVAAGEHLQVGVTVPSETWQAVLSGQESETSMGIILVEDDPLRRIFAGSDLVVLAVAGKSVDLGDDADLEARTDLVISAVVKGETRERVISAYHNLDDDPAGRLQPGDRVLALLEPRDAEDGEGYDSTAPSSRLIKLSAAEQAAYGERLEALERITRDGLARPADLLEWLVATTEDPATRKEAVGELASALGQLESQAEQKSQPAARYAKDLLAVLGDFLAAGGKPDREADPAIVAAFLTDAHRERLSAALLRTGRLTSADADLYYLARRWHDDGLQPWLLGRLEKGDLEPGLPRLILFGLAEELGDERLKAVVEAAEEKLGEIDAARYETVDDATRQRLDKRFAAAEDELRRKFLRALRNR